MLKETYVRANILRTIKLSIAAFTTAILVAIGLTATTQAATAEALPMQITSAVGGTFYKDISHNRNLQPKLQPQHSRLFRLEDPTSTL